MEWFDPTLNAPSREDVYLVCLNGMYYIGIYYFRDGHWHWEIDDYLFDPDYWMELPRMPK